jgi:hypothetical protein
MSGIEVPNLIQPMFIFYRFLINETHIFIASVKEFNGLSLSLKETILFGKFTGTGVNLHVSRKLFSNNSVFERKNVHFLNVSSIISEGSK